MRKVFAWLGAATLFMLMSSHAEAANDVLKPYVVLILDTSGSMGAATGSGPSSCGKRDTRINHAVCAINNIVNSYGDMVFALGRFREVENSSGTEGSQVCDTNLNGEGNQSGTYPLPTGGDICNSQGPICGNCVAGAPRTCTANANCFQSSACGDGAGSTTIESESGTDCANATDDDADGFVNDGCPTSGTAESGANCANAINDDSGTDALVNDGCPAVGFCDQGTGITGYGCKTGDSQFEMLAPLVDGGNATAAEFTDGSCNACSVASTAGTINPEIWGVAQLTFTPLAATLRGAQRYWEGQQALDGTGTTVWPATFTDGSGNTQNTIGYDPINRDPSAHVFLTANDVPTCSAQSSCVPFNPEVTCTGSADDDGDTRVNDGCPTQANGQVGVGPETQCADNIDNDGDGFINDGCPAWCNGTSCCCSQQCRPYITILLTDGDETCATDAQTVAAATDLSTVTPRSDQMPIATITRASNIVTITTAAPPAAPHPFKVGDQIQVFGAGITGFTNTFTVLTVPTPNTLTYAQTGANQTISGAGQVRHTASLFNYSVKTIPIAFGITAPNARIEDIAHAGGSPDVPSVNEGYYAADEADLELAISQILADSVRSELCNAKDDDCDIDIDEDFPNKGMTCTNGQLGVCVRTGTNVCKADGTGLQCNAVTVAPGTEGPGCNQLDDDCDGRIDEGLACQGCVPTGEICDNKDQDCDGVADRSCRCSGGTNAGGVCDADNTDCPGSACVCSPVLTRACGAGTCGGLEQCVGGIYDPNTCDADQVEPESCDGLDNDCDGVCDGIATDCSEQLTACNNNTGSCPATDSLGHPTKNPIPQNICRPGNRQCPLKAVCGGGNTFSACSGEVKACGPDAAPDNDPATGCDNCNGLDDDCDNTIDEDFLGSDCSTNCGIGTTVCQNGNIVCNSTAATSDATCDNIDDDCDGEFDEDWECIDVAPADGTCDACGTSGPDRVCMGQQQCVNGDEVCVGGPINPEVCNCLDDDCDGETDEDPDAANPICPGGGTCVPGSCQCSFGCAEGEFPCPLGKKCEMTPQGDFCLNDPCFNVTCNPVNGNAQTCIPKPDFANEPQCVDTCSLVNDADNAQFPNCAPTTICFGPSGECRPDDCTTFPDRCTGMQSCVAGQCISNPCDGVTCDTGNYCIGGECVASCADITCGAGQRCRQGACETDPCGKACPFGQACNDSTGSCIEDPCKFRNCQQGQWCNPNAGTCEDDPCVTSNITCPGADEVCRGGTCLDPDSFAVDAANESHVTVGGGGGCNTGGGNASLMLVLGALGLLVTRRRRTVGGAL